MASEVVREHEVAATPLDLGAGAQFKRWVKERRMPRALLECSGATIGKESLVVQM
jgi:hypothetical protein